jgi:hypothetical protein
LGKTFQIGFKSNEVVCELRMDMVSFFRVNYFEPNSIVFDFQVFSNWHGSTDGALENIAMFDVSAYSYLYEKSRYSGVLSATTGSEGVFFFEDYQLID